MVQKLDGDRDRDILGLQDRVTKAFIMVSRGPPPNFFFCIEEFYPLVCLQPCKSSQGNSLYANNISALPKIEKGLSQLILERKTCYSRCDCTGH